MSSVVNSSAAPVWLIVGGSRGIGLEFVKQVAESGAHVIATARELDQSPGLQSLLEKYGDKGPLQIVRLDISDVESIKGAAAVIADSHPQGIDYLVINAAINDNHVGPALDLDLNMFKRVFDVNVFGAFAAMQAFVPFLKGKLGGRKVVAVISSVVAAVSPAAASARDPDAQGPFDAMVPAYSASKSAITRVTMQLANEYKKEGYVFVAIHPGMIETDMAGPIVAKMDAAMVDSMRPHFTAVSDSVASQIALLEAATPKSLNGRFVDHKGEDMPW